MVMIGAHSRFFGEDSFSRHACGFFRALHRRVPVALKAYDRAPSSVPPDVKQMLQNARSTLRCGAGIGIGGPGSMARVRGTKRIAFVVWEPSVLPKEDARVLSLMDDVWTPSAWGKSLLVENGLQPHRVHVVPEGVDETFFTPGPARNDNGRFRFLSVSRWTVRKGLDDLVTAFCREFRPEEPLELVIRGGFAGQAPARLARVVIGPHAPIVLVPPCDDAALIELYRSADAFVLPTKGEGWGLPIVEAMACGLPVVVTDYSAPAGYLDESIAYLVRVQSMIPVYDAEMFSKRDHFGFWAQPDVDHLQSLMRHVYEHRAEAREKGRRARQAVESHLTWYHAAAIACETLGLAKGDVG
jgi:glycosyltransferase involved in cell wall biosynthesis